MSREFIKLFNAKNQKSSACLTRALSKVLSGSTAIFVFKNQRHRLFISTMVTLTKITNQPLVLSTCGFFYVREGRLGYNLVPHILRARSWSVGQVKSKN